MRWALLALLFASPANAPLFRDVTASAGIISSPIASDNAAENPASEASMRLRSIPDVRYRKHNNSTIWRL